LLLPDVESFFFFSEGLPRFFGFSETGNVENEAPRERGCAGGSELLLLLGERGNEVSFGELGEDGSVDVGVGDVGEWRNAKFPRLRVDGFSSSSILSPFFSIFITVMVDPCGGGACLLC